MTTSGKSTPTAPKPPATLQKLAKDALDGITAVKSRIDALEQKMDACTAAVVAMQVEQKKIVEVLTARPVAHHELEMDEQFVKQIQQSFPINNRETLERFENLLRDSNNVLIFVKYMADLHIKDSGISDGKKLVRSFVDHFFTRKFMLEVNRTGVRRSYGPPKLQLGSYQNILQTFHKCIRVLVSYFGYEGTKKALWRLCDTAVQRYKEAAVDKVEYEDYQQIDDEHAGEIADEIEDDEAKYLDENEEEEFLNEDDI